MQLGVNKYLLLNVSIMDIVPLDNWNYVTKYDTNWY